MCPVTVTRRPHAQSLARPYQSPGLAHIHGFLPWYKHRIATKDYTAVWSSSSTVSRPRAISFASRISAAVYALERVAAVDFYQWRRTLLYGFGSEVHPVAVKAKQRSITSRAIPALSQTGTRRIRPFAH